MNIFFPFQQVSYAEGELERLQAKLFVGTLPMPPGRWRGPVCGGGGGFCFSTVCGGGEGPDHYQISPTPPGRWRWSVGRAAGAGGGVCDDIFLRSRLTVGKRGS